MQTIQTFESKEARDAYIADDSYGLKLAMDFNGGVISSHTNTNCFIPVETKGKDDVTIYDNVDKCYKAILFNTLDYSQLETGRYGSVEDIYHYIYFDKTYSQYINTEWLMTQENVTFKMTFLVDRLQQASSLFGTSLNNSNWSGVLYSYSSTSNTYGLFVGSSGSIITIYPTLNNIHTLSISYVDKNIKLYFDNVLYTATYSGSIINKTYPLTLGMQNSMGQYSSFRLYHFQGYNDQTLMTDIVPALDGSSVPCVYDFVSGKYIHNSGGGNLIFF